MNKEHISRIEKLSKEINMSAVGLLNIYSRERIKIQERDNPWLYQLCDCPKAEEKAMNYIEDYVKTR